MSGAKRAFHRLRSFFRNSELDRELDSEMTEHLELAIEENLQRGMTPEEARRQAMIRFGGTEQAKEHHRDSRSLPSLEILRQDLRFTFRALRRDRAFALIAILTLGLGIGANVVVFSVVNTILLRPLPFQAPQRLMWLTGNKGVGGLSAVTYTVAAFEEFQRHNRSFEQVTSFQTFFQSVQYKIMGRGEPQSVSAVEVAENFFQTLGVQPYLGRFFARDECQKGGRPVMLLSYPYWQHQFASDPAIVGKTVTLNNQETTIIGVLPKTFDFGSVFSPGLTVDAYVPAVMDFWRTWGNTLAIVGRLKLGITPAQAQMEADALMPQLKAQHQDWWEAYLTTIVPLKEYVSGKLRRSLIALWCAVGMILLIVCVNLSNLLLARTAARSKEFAMRCALGAGRRRLLRQLLTESMVLAVGGAVLGLGVAFAGTSYLAHQGSIALPLMSSVSVDGAALAWTLLIALVAAGLFGSVPGLKVSTGNLQETLKDSGAGLSEGKKHNRLRAALVISEVALACVLLAGAGLLLRSFLHVLDVDLGFQPSHAASMKLQFDDGGKWEKRSAFLQQVLERVDALPGVEKAGMTDMLPLNRNRSWSLCPKERGCVKGEDSDVFVRVVTPGYIGAMGMRLVEGRDFTWHDDSNTQTVLVINQAAARAHWRGEDALGRLAVGISRNDAKIIGVIADVRQNSLEDAAGPEVFIPMTQAGPEGYELVVRTKLAPESLGMSVMSAIRAIDPTQPASEFRPIEGLVDRAVSPRRFFMLLVTIFAALGLVLAALGIYGVISYTVTRQTQEIGIRMALGASSAQVQREVISKTLRLALAGIALGTIASFVVAQWIAALLYATAPSDPATFAGVILLLSGVALAAGYIPARRASTIDPMVALRVN